MTPARYDRARTLSAAIESRLVALNPRRMRELHTALPAAYLLRAAQLLLNGSGPVLIGTGFPVAGSFETDGPVGAMALYTALQQLRVESFLVCGGALAQHLQLAGYRVLALEFTDLESARDRARKLLALQRPRAVVAIERPGVTRDGNYYNMRGEDISAVTERFDPLLELCDCPTIAVGDGGNEAGMGKLLRLTRQLDIVPSVTACDELVPADVSNWGAYGLIALLQYCSGVDLLQSVEPEVLLRWLCERGSVDGVTRDNTPTEDGLPAAAGYTVLRDIQSLLRQHRGVEN